MIMSEDSETTTTTTTMIRRCSVKSNVSQYTTKHVFGFGSFDPFSVQIKMFPISRRANQKVRFFRACGCDLVAHFLLAVFVLFCVNVCGVRCICGDDE